MIRRLSGVRALIVDRCPIYRLGISAQLTSEGATCHESASAEEAVELFKAQSCQLVVTEFRLSGQSGGWLVERLRKFDPAIRSVILCLGSESGVLSSLGAGADAVLFKDTPLCEFVACIDQVMKGSPFLNVEIQRILVRQLRSRKAAKEQERPDLTQREREVCRLLVKGNTAEQISEKLTISLSTVKTFFRSLYRKYEVTSRADLLVKLMLESKRKPRQTSLVE